VWNIQRIISKGDYNYAVVPEHPRCIKYGYVLEHRVIMENHLGRTLSANEVVHHINEDKKDNRLENLQVMTNEEHHVLHALQKGLVCVEMKCPYCNSLFVREKRRTHLIKKTNTQTCCSKRCGNLFFRVLSKGRTPEVEIAISGNLVREFNSLDNPEETTL